MDKGRTVDIPSGDWMWKPRSKLRDSRGNSKKVTGILKLRAVGAQQWNRRFVFIDQNALYYGKQKGNKDKVIPFEIILSTGFASEEDALKEKAPKQFAGFAWFLNVQGRSILFCAESASAVATWVHFVSYLLIHMRGAPAARPEIRTSSRSSSLTAPGAGAGAAAAASPLDSDDTETTETDEAASGPRAGSSAIGGDFEEESGTSVLSSTPAIIRFDNTHSGGSSSSSSSTDSDAEEIDTSGDHPQVDRQVNTVVLTPSSEYSQQLASKRAQDAAYTSVLIPLASCRYSHIEYMIPQLVPYFRSDDDANSVVFSRSLEKIGKHNNPQPRELVLTPRHLYLFARKRFGGYQCRCVDVDQIAGVMESLGDTAVFAVLIPSFHDIILRVVQSNSRVGGTLEEVKRQLIAHLYVASCSLAGGRRFLFQSVPDVKKVVRRRAEDKYAPLVSLPQDSMGAGRRDALFPSLRANSDNVVYWSSVARVAAKEGKTHHLRALVLTDGAFYFTSRSLSEIVRRTSWTEVEGLLYDRNSQGILVQCREVDALLYVQSVDEFNALLQVTPQIVAENFNRSLPCTLCLQLSARARLSKPIKESKLRRHKPQDLKMHLHHDDDNDAHGESQAALSALYAQYRFLEELVLDYDDEVALRVPGNVPPPEWNWAGVPSSSSAEWGDVVFSCACHWLDEKSVAALAKSGGFNHSTWKALGEGAGNQLSTLCVTAEGIFVLRGGGTPESEPSPSVSPRRLIANTVAAVSAGRSEPKLLEHVPWEDVESLVRCYLYEGYAAVGVMTSRTRQTDLMFNTLHEKQMAVFLSATIYCHARHFSEKGIYGIPLLPSYVAPLPDNVARALKASPHDPFPVLALRRTPSTATFDRLHLAVVPGIADVCRRFGDNTILFSGIAWRVRSATLRKKDGHLDDDPGDAMCRKNNNLYKSVVLFVTNCAIYYASKGGWEITRRTDLRDLTSIVRSSSDPDTVMLTVPKEYDIYVRVDGRGAELVSAVQEAYLEWTSMGLYFPHEALGSHTPGDYGLPQRTVPVVATLGNLTKPIDFNAMQANRSALECKQSMEKWHLKHLQGAVRRMQRALQNAQQQSQGGVRTSWAELERRLAEAQSLLYFTHRRAFRFGLRRFDFDEMQTAESLLETYRTLQQSAGLLVSAAGKMDEEGFLVALRETSELPELRALVDEQSARLSVFKKRKQHVMQIAELVQLRCPGERKPLLRVEKVLIEYLDEARRSGVPEEVLNYVITCVNRALLQEQFRLSLTAAQENGGGGCTTTSSRVTTVSKALLPTLASTLRVDCRDIPITVSSTAVVSPTQSAVDHAVAALHELLRLGDVRSTRYCINCLESHVLPRLASSDHAAAEHEQIAQEVTRAKGELALFTKHKAEVEQVDELAAALCNLRGRRHRNWNNADYIQRSLSEVEEVEAALPQDSGPVTLVLTTTRDKLWLLKALLTEQQRRLELRTSLQVEEKRMQEHYRQQVAETEWVMKRAAQARQQRDEEANARRAKETLLAWLDRSEKALASLVRSQALGNEQKVRQYIKQCVSLRVYKDDATADAGELNAIAARQDELRQTVDRAQLFLEQLETKSKKTKRECRAVMGEEGNSSEGGDSPTSLQKAFPELEQLLSARDEKGLIEFVQKHEEEMGGPLLRELKRRWLTPSPHEQAIESLRRHLRSAAVLKNEPLLVHYLSEAERIGIPHMGGADNGIVKRARQVLAVLQSPGGGDENLDSPLIEDSPLHTDNSGSVDFLESEPNTSSGEDNDAHERAESKVDDHYSAEADKDEERVEKATDELKETETPPPPSPPTAADVFLSQVLSVYSSTEPFQSQYSAVTSLYEALVAMIQFPECTFSETPKGERRAAAGSSNPYVARVLSSWLRALSDGTKTKGVFRKTPQPVLDVVTFIGEYNNNGEYAAPYVTRMVSDFMKLLARLRIGEITAQNEQIVSFMLIGYILEKSLMEHLIDGFFRVGEKGCLEVYQPQAVMAHKSAVRDLLPLAHMCSFVEWPYRVEDPAQLTALLILDAQQSHTTAPPYETKASVSVSSSSRKHPTSSTMVPTSFVTTDATACGGGTTSSVEVEPPSPLPTPGSPTAAPSLSEKRPSPPSDVVVAVKSACLKSTQLFVKELQRYFTDEVRRLPAFSLPATAEDSGATAGALASLFDESKHPAVASLAQDFLLPALLGLLECGRRAEGVFRRRTLWNDLVTFGSFLSNHAHGLGAAQLPSILDQAQAMTDPEGRNRVALSQMSPERVDDVRVAIFLRECLNRRQLFNFFSAFFPASAETQRPTSQEPSSPLSEVNEDLLWQSSGNGLRRCYILEHCALYPSSSPEATEIVQLIKKTSQLPFYLLSDPELRQ